MKYSPGRATANSASRMRAASRSPAALTQIGFPRASFLKISMQGVFIAGYLRTRARKIAFRMPRAELLKLRAFVRRRCLIRRVTVRHFCAIWLAVREIFLRDELDPYT